MTEYLPSYVNQLVLNDNSEEEGFVTGGYPMSSIIEQENITNQLLGGARKVGIERFRDLAIPFSLDMHYGGLASESNQEMKGGKKNRKEIIDVIDGGLFDKLLDSIVLAKKKNNKTTNTKKKNEIFDAAASKKTTRKLLIK
jgi:hypothetical protein